MFSAGAYLGSINCTGGASAKDTDSTCTKPDGTTAAINLATSYPKQPGLMCLQSNAAIRVVQGTAPTASNTPGAGYGVKVDVGQLYAFQYQGQGLACIPASGSGSAQVDIFGAVDSNPG